MKNNTIKHRVSPLFSTSLALATLLLAACTWDDGLYQEYITTVGDDESIQTQCDSLQAIRFDDGTEVTCTRESGKECNSNNITATKDNHPVDRSNYNRYIHSFNFNMCPQGYECQTETLEDSGTEYHFCAKGGLQCAANQHIYRGMCEDDSAEHCGSHEADCKSIITYANTDTVSCKNKKCYATECENGNLIATDINQDNDNVVGTQCVFGCTRGQHAYINNNVPSCQNDGIDNCGAEGNLCSNIIPHWKSGNCKYLNEYGKEDIQNGRATCVPDDCNEGYIPIEQESTDHVITYTICAPISNSCKANEHVEKNPKKGDGESELICVANDLDNCGAKDRKCNNLPGWVRGVCENGGFCNPSECQKGYHLILDGLPYNELNNNKQLQTCVPDSVLACGPSSTDCTKIPGWKTGRCEADGCIAETCQNTHHYSSETRSCEPNITTKCGEDATDCTQLEGWGDGRCTSGQCFAMSCQPNYCVTTKNVCVLGNQKDNCGNNGKACTSCTGELECIDGTCQVPSSDQDPTPEPDPIKE